MRDRRIYSQQNHYRTRPASNGGGYQNQEPEHVNNIKQKKGDLIGIIGLVINGILAIMAIVVYNQAQKQTKAAIKSADASVKSVNLADSVFRETKKYNDTAISIQKQMFDSSIIDGHKRSQRERELDKQYSLSLRAQIASIK